MTPQETKHIINVVVDYGWPFLVKVRRDADGKLTGEEDRFTVLDILLDYIRTHPVRLDPNHPHDWPIEGREGMPCWVRQLYDDEWSKWGQGVVFSDGQVYLLRDPDGISEHAPSWDKTDIGHEIQTVAPHPLNPTMEPPAGWSPEGRRILK